MGKLLKIVAITYTNDGRKKYGPIYVEECDLWHVFHKHPKIIEWEIDGKVVKRHE